MGVSQPQWLLWPCESQKTHAAHTEVLACPLHAWPDSRVEGGCISGPQRAEIIGETVLNRLLPPRHGTHNELKHNLSLPVKMLIYIFAINLK